MPLKTSGKTARMIACSSVIALCCSHANAQEDKKTTEPIYRMTEANTDTTIAAQPTNENIKRSTLVPAKPASAAKTTALAPIDRALMIAEDGLQHIRSDVRDYSAMLIKRERIDGIVGDPEYMNIKVRNRRESEGVPLSIYMNFLKPSKVKGREVIFVEGQNAGKLVAHEGTGMFKHVTAKLDPEGMMAMRGNRYPIHQAGIENLVYRLIEKGNRDKEFGDVEVKFYEKTKINKRECMLIQVTHPNKRPEYDFHICRVFIDKELNVPIRYSAYGWPDHAGGKPKLEEEYTYLNLALNIGLTDSDFDPKNGSYKFR